LTIVFRKSLQFGLRNWKLRYTAIHADEDLRKDPYCRLGQAVHSWKVDVDFGWIFTPIR